MTLCSLGHRSIAWNDVYITLFSLRPKTHYNGCTTVHVLCALLHVPDTSFFMRTSPFQPLRHHLCQSSCVTITVSASSFLSVSRPRYQDIWQCYPALESYTSNSNRSFDAHSEGVMGKLAAVDADKTRGVVISVSGWMPTGCVVTLPLTRAVDWANSSHRMIIMFPPPSLLWSRTIV